MVTGHCFCLYLAGLQLLGRRGRGREGYDVLLVAAGKGEHERTRSKLRAPCIRGLG